jgi:hypothetical protein
MNLSIVGANKNGDYEWKNCQAIGNGYKIYFHMPNEVPSPFHLHNFVTINNRKKYEISAKFYKPSTEFLKFPSQIRGCYIGDE